MYPIFELLAKEKPQLFERLSQEQYVPFFRNMQDVCGAGFCGKASELTPGEMSLCYCVHAFAIKNNGSMPTVAEIASKLNVSVPAISRTLKNLEAKEYIHRTPDPSDRRIVHISLTEKGGTVMTENSRVIADVMDKVLAQFTDEELETMLRLHTRFTSAVSQVLTEIRQTS